MEHNQSQEDYIEAILVLSETTEYVHQIDVARKMKVSQPAVQKALKLLVKSNYIKFDGLHIYLTEEGRKVAEAVYDRHKTITKFWESFGVSSENAEEDACVMEHVVSDETYAAIKEYVNKLQK